MKKYIIISLTLIFIISGGLFLYNHHNKNINTILKTDAYSYLSPQAKEYVKRIYEQTGELVLTEKNKKANRVYLNPKYIEYLSYNEEEKKEIGNIPPTLVVDYNKSKVVKGNELPSSYNLENDNQNSYITPIRDQGSLGLCWAFASAGAAESHLLRKNDIAYSNSSLLISERQIDYAMARNGLKDYKSEYKSFINRNLGSGGNFYISTIAMANGISLVDYNSFKPYNPKDMSKMELYEVLSHDNSKYELNSTTIIPRNIYRESTSILTQEEKNIRDNYLNEVKRNILENGAAYVGTDMGSACNYVDTNLNNTVIDEYECSANGGHAMEIIGWNDNLEYSYCADTKIHQANTPNCNKVVNGKGVWILKNSWGEDIPNPYLAYDSLNTDITFINDLETTTNKDWDNNYIFKTYDNDELENATTLTYYLNNTKIKNSEKIKKVKFIANEPNSTYTLKVYKTNNSYEEFTKTIELPGLVTIPITKDITITKDSKIEITSNNTFIDRVSIFTKNIDNTPSIDLSQYNNMTITREEFRLYSETKNIPSGTVLAYKIYNSNNQDISNQITITNNIVAENNINTLINIPASLPADTYRIDVLYNSNVIGTMSFKTTKMEGTGTESDPYIITDSVQLKHIERDLSAYYELGNDIDLTEDTREGGILSKESTTCPQGFGWESINGFSGTLDGKGHTIKGLYQNNYLTCNEEKEEWIEWAETGTGLFATATGDVTIKNLVLEDFDLTCQDKYCGALISNYISNVDQYGNVNFNDQTVYNATFENIAIKNSKMKAINNNYSNNDNIYGGGLFGQLNNIRGAITLSNIYIDIDSNRDQTKDHALLSPFITSKNTQLKNIRLLGNLNDKTLYNDVEAPLVSNIYSYDPLVIRNILSTVTGNNISGNLFKNVYGEGNNFNLDGANIIRNSNYDIAEDFNPGDTATINNVNYYNKDTELSNMVNYNYSNWEGFNNNWKQETIDGIKRLPVLKFMDFEYTSIDNISINQKLNDYKTIYDYIEPKTNAAKQISYKSNNEKIVKIDEKGRIIPQKTGSTTIHIESLYDGYINDVPISVTYKPHYSIIFDANGGEGNMDNFEAENGQDAELPENQFTKENYEFNGWNTKADGTGTSYSDMDTIQGLADKEELTLYAQWIGEELIVTFDPNGGEVTPTKKTVRYDDIYGELPIPTRNGYVFTGWTSKGKKVYATYKVDGLNLKANWSNNVYAIIYDANGGKHDSRYGYNSNDQIISLSRLYTTSSINNIYIKSDGWFSRENYEFKGWNTKANGTGTNYEPGSQQNINNLGNSPLILYAIWEESIPITKIELNKSTLNLVEGNSEKLTLTITPANTTDDKTITWTSNDSTIATVDSNGNVTAKKAGTTKINAQVGERVVSCTVTVTPKDIAVTGISLNKTNLTLEEGETYNLVATITPSNATNKTVTWKVLSNIATVDSNGKVTALKEGGTTVIATTSNGKTASCSIEITKKKEINLIPVYRMYNPINGEHLYTTDAYEVSVIYKKQGWGKEGIGWFTAESGTPVYRLYNPKLGNHLYTSDRYEISVITRTQGWVLDFNGEPVMYASGDVPIYRLFNPGLQGQHHLTTDFNEYNVIPQWGWQQEGEAMKAQKIGKPEQTNYYR